VEDRITFSSNVISPKTCAEKFYVIDPPVILLWGLQNILEEEEFTCLCVQISFSCNHINYLSCSEK
jgi:hypothetical protein